MVRGATEQVLGRSSSVVCRKTRLTIPVALFSDEIAVFNDHFGQYGEIIDSVIMKDRFTGLPRGFGFITYGDHSVVDKVMEDTHVINGKQVEIKRTIPKGAAPPKELKTKKIFVGGIPSTVSEAVFNHHFGQYGEIIDSVIMKDRFTGLPRGFGFITYGDHSVVDKVMEDTHVINGKQVEIKRTIPKGAAPPKELKTKKIFVGGIPSTVSEDEFKSFFSTYGEVVEHNIIRDCETNRSRGFGFIIFDKEEVVDSILSNGNMLDFAGIKVLIILFSCLQVEIKKAEPEKPSNPRPAPGYRSNPRARSFGHEYGPHDDSYTGFNGGYGPSFFRNPGGSVGRFGAYNSGYATGLEFGPYPGYPNSSASRYHGDPSMGYASRFGLGRYTGSMMYGPGGSLGYGRMNSYGDYDDYSYRNPYDSSSGAGYPCAGGFYGKGGYIGNSRYHPYAR
ncbi:Heterogeneous nuclear ribonucleoprotein 1-like protein [Drosera capensis]